MDAYVDFELSRLDDEAAADTVAEVELADVREPAGVAELSGWLSQWLTDEAQRAGIPADLLPPVEHTSGAAFTRIEQQRADRLLDRHISGAVELEPHPPGFCYVCGAELTGERKLLCSSCADPNGAVASASRKLRTSPPMGPRVDPCRVCIVPGCGQPIGPHSWDGRHCTSCYAGELGDPRAPRSDERS